MDPGKSLIVRWSEGKASDVALLKSLKADAVWLDTPQPEFSAACATAGIPTIATLETVKGGLWPGIRSAGRRNGPEGEVASASSEPWVDANGYLVACQRAIEPGKTPVLAYSQTDPGRMVAFETLEIGLAEAWMMGGNSALQVEDRYLRGLRANDSKALAAWNKLARTADWLKQNRSLFGHPSLPSVVALYDGRGGTRELCNLLYRRNASPRVVSAPPATSPQIKALVAASIATPAPALRTAILAHAEAGASVVVDADWWREPRAKLVKEQEDRAFYALGKGQVVAYHKRIAEPSEFALDVIDIVTHRQRATRLWNAPAIIAVATEGVRGGAILNLLNYGTGVPQEIQAHIQGTFSRALMRQPGMTPTTLPVAKRATMTEVFVPKLERACSIEFTA